MRRAVLLAAACSSAPAPVPPAAHHADPPAPTPGLAAIHHGTLDADLGALDPETLRRELVALLRDPAHLRCDRLKPSACAGTEMGEPLAPIEPELAADAGIADPCVRREIALRALNLLTRDDLLAIGDADIAQAASADASLAGFLMGQVAQQAPDHLLPIAIRVRGIPQTGLSLDQLPDTDLADARAHHLYAAVDRYDRDGKLAILTDTDAPAHLRWSAIVALVDEDTTIALPADVRAALVLAAGDRDCLLAAQAAQALADHGETGYLAARPRGNALDAHARTLCVAAGELLVGLLTHDVKPVYALLASYQDPHGQLAIATRGQPPWLVAPGQFRPNADDNDLLALLSHCRGAHCAYYDRSATLAFAPAPDGGLYLTRIDIDKHEGACDGAYGP